MTLPIVLTFSLAAAPVLASPIQCSIAHTARERTLCADPSLLATDRKLAMIYDRLQASLSPAAASAVREDQRDWLGYLDQVCTADMKDLATCLGMEYQGRIEQLSAGFSANQAPQIYTRTHVALHRNPAGQRSDAMDPGYSQTDLAWPQIDRPTQEQALWNRQVQTRVATLVLGSMPQMQDDIQRQIDAAKRAPFPASLDGVLLGWDQSSLAYAVEAANDRLLSITFHLGTDNYGAAHGGDSAVNFAWWLDRGRPLQPTDVFRPESDWKDVLLQGTKHKLQHQAALQQQLWTGNGLQNDLSRAVADVSLWRVSREGLTLIFGEYQVAAYSAGEPQVHFTWQELQSCLNPTLDIARLPSARPHGTP